MENEDFSPIIDKKKKKKENSNENTNFAHAIANDPQVEVNDTASAHAQTENEQNLPQNPQKKVKAKHGQKPFAFFSGVFDIIVALAIVGLGLWVSMLLFTSVDTGISKDLDTLLGFFYLPFIIIIMAIAATAGVLFFVDGILSLISSFKSDRKNWNGVIVAAAVFDVLLLFPSVFMIFASDGNMRILSIALTVILVVTFIFKMVDISLTKRRLKIYQQAKQEENKETYHGPNFDNLNVFNQSNTPQTLTQNDAQKAQTEKDSNASEDDQNGQSSGVDFSKLGK